MNLYPPFATILKSLPALDVYADLPTWREALRATAGPTGTDNGVQVEDIVIPGVNSGDVPVRIYRPAAQTGRASAAAVWIHGGGFAIGAPNAEDAHCRRLTRELGIVIAAPDYRLAPEHPYPAAFDDCLATFDWLGENATANQVDPARIALGGHSAGASLATAVALALGDRPGLRPAYLFAGYPVLDDRQNTPSARAIVDPRLWNRPQAQTMWSNYLGSARPELGYAVPARAQDLSGLPPMFVMTCELDPSRDEGQAFAARARAAGVLVETYDVPGVPHMFDVLLPDAPMTDRAVKLWTAALAEGLGLK